MKLQKTESLINRIVKLEKLLQKRNEGFKDTDPLSPSEMAAVCSQWTHSNGDSFKYDDDEFVVFDLKPTNCYLSMRVTVDRKDGSAQVSYASLGRDSISYCVSSFIDSVDSADECDDVFTEMMETIDEDLSNESEYVFAIKNIPSHATRKQVESILDKCLDEHQASEDALANAWDLACSDVTESCKRVSRRKR